MAFQGRLRLITGPTVEPVTTADVKLNARVAHTKEDTIIAQWIKAGRIAAEQFQKKSYLTQTWKALFDCWPKDGVELPMSPLQSVTSIKYYDIDNTEYTFDSANYFVDTISEVGRIALNDSADWPSVSLRSINSVVIEYVTGYGATADTVPENVKNAIYIYCTYMYENREGEMPIPEAFKDLLRPERMFI